MKKNTAKEIKKDLKDFVDPSEPLKTVSKPTFIHRNTLFLIFLGIIFITSAILSILAKVYPYFPIDLTITLAIQQFNMFWFDSLMKFISSLGNFLPSILLTITVSLFLYSKKRMLDSLMLLISTIGVGALSGLLKSAISRNRPDPTLVNQLDKFFRTDSFPSGHVLFFVGFFGFIFFLVYTLAPKNIYRTIILVTLSLLIVLVGPSRIYLGAHWFSDVLGAYLVGTLWISLMILIYDKLKLKK